MMLRFSFSLWTSPITVFTEFLLGYLFKFSLSSLSFISKGYFIFMSVFTGLFSKAFVKQWRDLRAYFTEVSLFLLTLTESLLAIEVVVQGLGTILVFILWFSSEGDQLLCLFVFHFIYCLHEINRCTISGSCLLYLFSWYLWRFLGSWVATIMYAVIINAQAVRLTHLKIYLETILGKCQILESFLQKFTRWSSRYFIIDA